jgi:hypothetical protein
MNDSEKDIEWLKRIRENQISQRDPGVKGRQLQQKIIHRYRVRKTVRLGELVGGLSNKLKGLFIGLLLSFGLWFILALVFQEAWVDIVGLVMMVVFPGFGIIFGNALDIRDRLRDV